MAVAVEAELWDRAERYAKARRLIISALTTVSHPLASFERLFDTGSVNGKDSASWRDRQRVLNSEFPPAPVPRDNVAEPIAVVARIVWESDGQEHVHCLAVRWTRTHVLVKFAFEERRASTTWLRAGDVARAAVAD
jgi:hypothetical protein